MANIITAKEVIVEREGKNQTIELPVDLIDKLASNEKAGLLQFRIPFVISEVPDTSINSKAGLKKYDRVLFINDSLNMQFHDQVKGFIKNHKNETISLTVARGNENIKIENVKISSEGNLELLLVNTYKELDSLKLLQLQHTEYGFFESIPAGIKKTWNTLMSYIDQFKLIISPSTGGYKHMGGFISMGKIFQDEWDWQGFWNRTAFISVILAFMNLLPIPALDGGHVLFTLWEMITRKAPSVKFLTYAQYVGMAFLLLLMIYANGNDIIKLFR
jgi:regulator of sigma E protease